MQFSDFYQWAEIIICKIEVDRLRSFFKVFTVLTPLQMRQCVVLFLFVLIGSVLEAVGIGAIMPLLKVMGQPDILDTHLWLHTWAQRIGIATHAQLVVIMAALLILFYLAKNLFIALQARLQIWFAINQQVLYSKQIMYLYLERPYLFYLNHNSATLLRNVTGIGECVFSGILVPLFYLLSEMATATFILVLLFMIDALTAVIVAGVMGGVLVAILKGFRRIIARQAVNSNMCQKEFMKWVNQGIGSIKETKVMQNESFFFKEFSRSYAAFGVANRTFGFFNSLPRIIIEVFIVTALLSLIIVKILMGAMPSDILPLLGVLALAAFRLMPSANRIVSTFNNIKFQMPFFEEMYEELLKVREKMMDGETFIFPKKGEKMPFAKKISIEHISFRYAKDSKIIFSDVDFVIPKGAFVGIVGASGVGKTTLVDILLGLLEPNKGRVTVDNVDIKEQLSGWRSNLAYVPQVIYLIDASIAENIALGEEKDNIDLEHVQWAVRMAGLSGFVRELPSGLDTQVGDRGVRLSGGQRQRIGIARALYQNPEILVLDEATSALDSETEKAITKTILNFKGKLTIISIAHRLSTLENCDFKVRLVDGKSQIE